MHGASRSSCFEALAAELAQAAGDLFSPAEVNHVLVKTFHVMAAGRIPTRKAGTMRYSKRTSADHGGIKLLWQIS
jgi:hypothetical protein